MDSSVIFSVIISIAACIVLYIMNGWRITLSVIASLWVLIGIYMVAERFFGSNGKFIFVAFFILFLMVGSRILKKYSR